MTGTDAARPTTGDRPPHATPAPTLPDPYDIDPAWLNSFDDERLAVFSEQLDDAILAAKRAGMYTIDIADLVNAAASARILLRRRKAHDAIRQARATLDEMRPGL